MSGKHACWITRCGRSLAVKTLCGTCLTGHDPIAASPQVVYRLPRPSYHVWTVGDLNVLNELHNPVAVTVSGVFENPHRYGGLLCRVTSYTYICCLTQPGSSCRPGGLQHTCRTVFQNTACQQQFGLPRGAEAFAKAIDNLPEGVRLRRRNRLKSNLLVRAFPCSSQQIMLVYPLCNVNIVLFCFQGKLVQTRMDVHELFGPNFDGITPDMPQHLARIDSKVSPCRSSLLVTVWYLSNGVQSRKKWGPTLLSDHHCV